MITDSKTALVMIDIQNDFCQHGSLAVPDGDAVVSLANELQAHFDLIVATQDWHPENHMSFAANHQGRKPGEQVSMNQIMQTLWPSHCIQHSKGAEFHPGLNKNRISKVILKGIDPVIDSYSAFYDNAHLRSTGLADYLKAQNVHNIYIMGLATDYCVKYSCLDAIQLGFNVHAIIDACRGVNLRPDDVAMAIEEMEAAGVKMVKTADIIA